MVNTRYIHIFQSKIFPRQSYRMQNPRPVPRAVFPVRLPFRRLPLPFRHEERRSDCVHDQAADRAPDRSSDRCVSFVPSPVPFLSPCSSRPSHPLIYLVVRSLVIVPFPSSAVSPVACPRRLSSSRSSPRRATSKAGRCCRMLYRCPIPSVSAYPIPLDMAMCRGRMSQDVA